MTLQEIINTITAADETATAIVELTPEECALFTTETELGLGEASEDVQRYHAEIALASTYEQPAPMKLSAAKLKAISDLI